MDQLLYETRDKKVIIAKQNQEFERLHKLLRQSNTMNDVRQRVNAREHSNDINMELDAVVLNHLISGVTIGVLEPMNTPIGQRTPTFMPPSFLV
jgi:hypothetical protein